jgi:hypothetical protein
VLKCGIDLGRGNLFAPRYAAYPSLASSASDSTTQSASLKSVQHKLIVFSASLTTCWKWFASVCDMGNKKGPKLTNQTGQPLDTTGEFMSVAI